MKIVMSVLIGTNFKCLRKNIIANSIDIDKQQYLNDTTTKRIDICVLYGNPILLHQTGTN